MDEKNKVFVRVEKYDPLTGVFIRDMRTNDLVYTVGTKSVATSTVIATSTNGANTNLYPYIFHAACTSTGINIFALMAGTTTMGIYATDYYGTINIVSTPEAPLGKVAASTTLSVEAIATAVAGATVAVTVISNRLPINTKI